LNERKVKKKNKKLIDNSGTAGRIKILFILDRIDKGGGAQRATLNIIKHLNRKKFQPALLLINAEKKYEYTEDNTLLIGLNKKKVRSSIFKLAAVIRAQKPDIVFSTMTYLNALVYLSTKLLINKPKLVMRSATIESSNIAEIEPFVVRLLAGKAYRSAAGVIVMTEAMSKDLIENLDADPMKLKIIPNMADIPLIKEKSLEKLKDVSIRKESKPLIGAMGRLSVEKGFDILLKAFSEYTLKKPAKLLIIGEGSERGELERLAGDLGVKREVIFAGHQDNPYPLLKECDLFVLPSRYEGFPNALLEAMALGIPVIASDVRSGPSDIITPGLNGILITPESDKELLEAMERVLSNREYRENLKKGALERAADFAPEVIIKEYEKFFGEISAGSA